MSRTYLQHIEKINELNRNNEDYTVVTLIDIKGSAPQNVGAKIIVNRLGLYFGTVGGGKIEKCCIDFALNLMRDKSKAVLKIWNLQKDIGMTCGGEVSVFFEPFVQSSKFKVAVFGAGHIAQELVPMLCKLNATIYCIDSRDEWLEKIPTQLNLKKVKIENLENYVSELSSDTYIISVTKGHASDTPVIAKALQSNFSFVGCIGSIAKRNVIEKELISDYGLKEEIVKKMICPIGEKFGSNDPVEISFSIIAQLLKERGLN